MTDISSVNSPICFQITGSLRERIYNLAKVNDLKPISIIKSALNLYCTHAEDGTINSYPNIYRQERSYENEHPYD
jgi:hypothetical protein